MEESKPTGKSFAISKRAVWTAYERRKANKGAPGVDGCTVEEFEKDLKNNLYKIWNRLSSGTYFPPPVKAVEISKSGGGVRTLGIPTVSDRIAQTVVAMELESGGGTDLPCRFLWLPSWQVGSGRGWDVPAAVLENGLGC